MPIPISHNVNQFIGPKLMKNRDPFQLQKTIVFYNLLQMLFSAYVFYEMSTSAWLRGYSFRCEPCKIDYGYQSMRTVRACWLHLLSKYTELLDTVFFVLRKRFDLVSPLHLVHHGIMPLTIWCGIKFLPTGHGTFPIFLNSGVHVMMYMYYMLAAMGPKMRKFLWWKRHLTQLQIIQFVAVFIHSSQLLFKNECNYPTTAIYINIFLSCFFFMMFKGEIKKSKYSVSDLTINFDENILYFKHSTKSVMPYSLKGIKTIDGNYINITHYDKDKRFYLKAQFQHEKFVVAIYHL